MKYTLNIQYSVEQMEKSQRRINTYVNFERADQIPVRFCIVPRFFAKQLGVTYKDIFKSADAQFEYLLEFAKYQFENIYCDVLTQPILYSHPYFDNATSASHFGGHIEWPENETLQALPSIKTIDQMKDFKIPEPDAGLFGVVIKWWKRMQELTDETQIAFDGVPGKVVVPDLNLMPLGPHMIAIDLVGTDFYWWCIEAPDLCKEFLLKITNGLIESEEYIRRINPRNNAYISYFIAEDSSTIMSPSMFKEFVIPYDKILYDRFGKKTRSMHMCGPSTHLHDSLVNDLHITDFDMFGYQVEPSDIAVSMGGRVHLWGNINPMLMLNGSKEEVKQETYKVLEHLAPMGGLHGGRRGKCLPGYTVGKYQRTDRSIKRICSAASRAF